MNYTNNGIDLENKIEDEISKIKNVKDVYDFMDKNIQYGWIDIYENVLEKR